MKGGRGSVEARGAGRDRRAHRVGMNEANEHNGRLAQIVEEDGSERVKTGDEGDNHHSEGEEGARVDELLENAVGCEGMSASFSGARPLEEHTKLI